MAGSADILDFWFGETGSLAERIASHSRLWWSKSESIDQEIRERFGSDLVALLAGELEQWKASAEGWLAMIILADQFSRNMYRDDARAFAQDDLALALCLEGLEQGIDQQLDLLQRVFFYLPLEHSELSEMQQRSVAQMKKLVELAPGDLKKEFEGFHNYALAHLDVIEKYGRFPHRNAILGRDSSKEELAYLARPDAGF